MTSCTCGNFKPSKEPYQHNRCRTCGGVRKSVLRLKQKQGKAIKRTRTAKKRRVVRKNGKTTVSVLKRQIQAKIRERVIERDGGCILRHYPEAGACGGFNGNGDLILQGEHLNGRANSVSYGELDNIVCLCQYHHIFFKRQNPARYWVLIQRYLAPERWSKVQAWILDRTPHRFTKSDWEAVLLKLTT